MYLSSYIIINFYWLFPLFLEISIYTAMLVAIALILAFVYITHDICKDEALGFYFFFVWDLFCLLPLGMRIAIFIRLFLFITMISSDGLDYILYTKPWDFSSILNTAENGSSSSGVVLPPNNGGNTPPSGEGLDVNNPRLDSILNKLRLQNTEVKSSGRSIYWNGYTAEATLNGPEREQLGSVISAEAEAGRSGIYRVITRYISTGPESRVVTISSTYPDATFTSRADVYSSKTFTKYVEGIAKYQR